jgi:hypothetical protein
VEIKINNKKLSIGEGITLDEARFIANRNAYNELTRF